MRQIKVEVQSAMTKDYDKNELLRRILLDSITIFIAGEVETSRSVYRCDPFTTQAERKWKRIIHHHSQYAAGNHTRKVRKYCKLLFFAIGDKSEKK